MSPWSEEIDNKQFNDRVITEHHDINGSLVTIEACKNCLFWSTGMELCTVIGRPRQTILGSLGPVHTNSFSNENGAVLLCFPKDLRPQLSFSYQIRLSTVQRRFRFENALILSLRVLN